MSEITKRCPSCGGELVVRTNRATGSEFLGCRRWGGDDGCRHTEPVPESLRLRLAGHATLPGLG